MPAPKKKTDDMELSMKNTKQELLDAYHEMLQQLHEKEEAQLKPEQKLKEKKEESILKAVAGISADGVIQEINKLKQEIGGMLNKLADRLAAETNKFDQVQLAIEIKERELKEIYEIEKAAATLAALIETQRQEKLRFEEEMANKQASLTREIEVTKLQWQKEKAEHQAEIKELQEQEDKDRKRKKEEYEYAFEREQQLARDKFEDEKAKLLAEKQALENQMKALKEQTEKELSEREKQINSREKELESLQAQVAEFPQKLETAVAKAVQENTERIELETKYQKDLLQKDFEGQRNVLTARIQSLEKTVKEQNEQIAKLSTQQDTAYQKIQDVAVKAIEGASKANSFSDLQHVLSEQIKKKQTDDH
jgi:chromosome segregation ATPase